MKPCERMIIHRAAEAVPWCKTHQQEMLTGLRCATGWDEEIEALRAEIAEIKLRMNQRMAL
jgi:hypothetical protein